MMRVKRTQYPKATDDDILKLSTDFKNFVIKIQEEIKIWDKIINEYAKIINGTKKEYQKLNAENIRFEQKLQQQLEQEIREKELRAYKQRKQYDRQFVRRPKKPTYGVKKNRYYLEIETKSELDNYDFGYDESSGKPLKKKTKSKKRNRRNLSNEEDSKDEMEDESESESENEEAKKPSKKYKSPPSTKKKKRNYRLYK